MALRIRLASRSSEEEGSTQDASAPAPRTTWKVVERFALPLLLGAIFVLLGVRFGWSGRKTELVLACLYAAMLFEIAVIDFHSRLVLNILSYPTAVIAIIGAGFWSGIGVTGSLLGGVVALILFSVIELVGRGAMGRGDTKLATVVGLMRGYPTVWQALVIGILVGGAFAISVLMTRRGKRTSFFAYGPALALGAVISMLITPK